MKRLVPLMIGIFFAFVALSAQEAIQPDTVMQRLLTQTQLFPQENIYVQTDKSDYVVGDTIWFRVYLVNAISRKPEHLSRYVYAELIGAQVDTVVCRVKVRKDSLNRTYGYMALPPSLLKGIYHFRAYTRYACNWEEDCFFNKSLRIYTKHQKEPSQGVRPTTDYQVDFLPEGGQAIDGQLCRIAFKAQNKQGNGENIHAALVDEKGDTLTQFSCLHNGMGEFSFIPLADKSYVARCMNEEGQERRFRLPQAVSNAAALKVMMQQEQCYVSVVHDSLFEMDALQLIVLQRGHPCFARHWDNLNTSMLFPKQAFDTGIVQFLLLAANGKILSERLIFIQHPDNNQLTFTANQTKHSPRQRVEASIEWKDTANHFLNGSCSVSVTDATDIPLDETTHILSTLLLTADLIGTIEAPGWYFETTDVKKRSQALDVLMRIHGWRRYDLQGAIDGRYTLPSQLPEVSMQLSGDVRTPLGKPLSKSNVQIYAQGTSLMTQVETDAKGRFNLSGFEVPDNVKYLITALSYKGKENVVLQMDAEKYPIIMPKPNALFGEGSSFREIPSIDEEKYMEKSIQNMEYNEGMRHYLLNEVKITARAKKVYQTEFEQDASVTIKEDRIQQSGLPNLRTILIASGKYQSDDQIGSIKFALDGVLVEDYGSDHSTTNWLLNSFNVDDIGQIDIIKGPLAAGYFQGKQELVIAITTKRGGESYNARYIATNRAVWTPLGYQQPIEKYSPRYDQPSAELNKLDMRTTIYWKPDVAIKDGKAHFSFYNADSPSSYNVVIEGVSTEGKIFRKVQKLFH